MSRLDRFIAACVSARTAGHNPEPPGGCPCSICSAVRDNGRILCQDTAADSPTLRRLVSAGMELSRALRQAETGPCVHMERS